MPKDLSANFPQPLERRFNRKNWITGAPEVRVEAAGARRILLTRATAASQRGCRTQLTAGKEGRGHLAVHLFCRTVGPLTPAGASRYGVRPDVRERRPTCFATPSSVNDFASVRYQLTQTRALAWRQIIPKTCSKNLFPDRDRRCLSRR